MFAARPRRTPSKVVTIPVHFVESKPNLPFPAAATRIQKAFRGHAVRRGLRAVRGLEAEVERAEREVEEGRVLRDEKERLRLGETLMGVLFRLDSVRGVREYRKRVVRRVVRLQEKLDSLADEEKENGIMVEKENRENGVENGIMVEEEKRENGVENGNMAEAREDGGENGIMVEEKRENGEDNGITEERENGVENGREVGGRGEKVVEGKREEMEKGVMERMVEESERLRGVVTELLEKNALQCNLMCGLTKRVEDLERKVNALGRNKKKTNKKRKN